MTYETFAQQHISGIVVDAAGEPLMGVIVQAKHRDTQKTATYQRTDAEGHYELDVPHDCMLEFSLLGFKRVLIDNLSDKRLQRVLMQEEATTLKEVTVKASKLHENGDTLTYHVSTFADQNDRSIGDVLARIPGFEVNKQTGQIRYEGKPVSKFYIEGLDMLGDKYGVATNSLPQVDVGSIQVMKHHQPIRVLEEFTFTDEAAVNIRMKEGAKSHWVSSLNGGAGIGHDTGLWKAEGLGLRLKTDFQTMLTYKTNNTGTNIGRETTSLINLDDWDSGNDYISLAAPLTPSLAEQRTLFNRSHTATANGLKRMGESSQINIQMVYGNHRETAVGKRQTDYFLPKGNRRIDNRKDYLRKNDDLYALVKYEKNNRKQYLRNALSGSFTWNRQWLNESQQTDMEGTTMHRQLARKPVYDIKDQLYIIRKYGNSLLSFYSNNRALSRPQSLSVDSAQQQASQQQFSTNTYMMGGFHMGKLKVLLRTGIKASLYHLKSEAEGIPDSLGGMVNNIRFVLNNLYFEPKLTFNTQDFDMELSPTSQFLYEKYSEDKAHRQVLFSPNATVKWNATANLKFSIRGQSSVEPCDPNRFYDALIMQDYQYINQGWRGYLHDKTQSVGGSISYNDALRALYTGFSVSRSINTSPYTITRQFVGDYIILSATEEKAKARSWNVNLTADKGINLWNGVASIRVLYINRDATMLQNCERTDFNSQLMNVNGRIDFSFWKDMHFRYGMAFRQNRMKMQSIAVIQKTDSWKQDMSLIIPFHAFSIELKGEYYRNKLASDTHNELFLADIRADYRLQHIDLTISINNLLNKENFSYFLTRDLMTSSSTNRIRGREILFTAYYRL
jgi:hypothetical protein